MRQSLIFFLPTLLALTLASCVTTGNISTKYDVSALKNSGLVLFSVTHDKNTEYFFRRGTDIRFNVYFRNTDNNIEIPAAFSNDTLALIVTSQFDAVWGRAYVREFAAGRYEVSGWSLEQGIGAKTRTTKPKKPLPPIAFDVKAGSVTYIGNVHGSLQWGRKMPMALNLIGGADLAGGVIAEIRSEYDRDAKVILEDYPQLADRIVVRPLPNGPWIEDAPGRTTLSKTEFTQACMKYEEPLAQQRIGQGEIKTKEDATAFAEKACAALAEVCANDPASEKCRSVATPFGLASEQGSSTAAELLNAATRGETDRVKSLLAGGVDTNVRNAVGWTPLMLAAAERHTSTVEILLEAGADPNAENALGRTALMFAASYGQDSTVQLLLDRGAKPNIVPKDHSGWTALMAAAARGHVNTVGLLLQNGADPNIRSKDGRTAIKLERDEGRSEVVKKLSATGN